MVDLTFDVLKAMLRQMLRIRRIEEAVQALFRERQMRCPVHLSIGQEAAAVGVCSALRAQDQVFSTHRCHAHYLAKGGDLFRMLAEFYGRDCGCAGGMGGSMHLVDQSVGMMGTSSIVASSIPLGVGAAWQNKLAGTDKVVAVFFGDGATEEGAFAESLNFAALHKLRVLFVCEDNGLATYTPSALRQPAGIIPRRAAVFMPCHCVTYGEDCEEVFEAAQAAVEATRSGPAFLYIPVPRLTEHVLVGYTKKKPPALEGLEARFATECPIAFTRRELEKSGQAEELAKLSPVWEQEIADEIQSAVQEAQRGSFPSRAATDAHVLSLKPCGTGTLGYILPEHERNAGLVDMSMGEAISRATVESMQEDQSVVLIGEGVPDHTGVYGTTLEAREQFSERVFESPLSEDAVTGICGGAALVGARPILVHQRIEFMMLTMNQLVNNVSKWRYTHAGRAGSMPMVIRSVIGRGFGQSARHSQALQALVAHIPGLMVVMPSDAYTAKGLFLASVRNDDPVIFIEHRSLHSLKMLVPAGPYELPLGQARVAMKGSDITVVASSFMVVEALEAAAVCEQHNISVEVIDLLTLNPLDQATIVRSVEKTGHLVVADLSWHNCGVASTVAAIASEQAFHALKAPVRSVCLPATPTPCSWPLEDTYYPGAKEILGAISQTLGIPFGEYDSARRLASEQAFRGPF